MKCLSCSYGWPPGSHHASSCCGDVCGCCFLNRQREYMHTCAWLFLDLVSGKPRLFLCCQKRPLFSSNSGLCTGTTEPKQSREQRGLAVFLGHALHDHSAIILSNCHSCWPLSRGTCAHRALLTAVFQNFSWSVQRDKGSMSVNWLYTSSQIGIYTQS